MHPLVLTGYRLTQRLTGSAYSLFLLGLALTLMVGPYGDSTELSYTPFATWHHCWWLCRTTVHIGPYHLGAGRKKYFQAEPVNLGGAGIVPAPGQIPELIQSH